MTSQEVGSLLSLLSLLLASYGFFWNATKDAFEPLGLSPSDIVRLDRAPASQIRRRLERLRPTALVLALAPTVVALLFVNTAVSILEDVSPEKSYSAERAGIVVIILFWAGLGLYMWWRVTLLWRIIDALRSKDKAYE